MIWILWWASQKKFTKVFMENSMKKLALAAVISLSASTAFAGGMAEPVMEPEVMVEEASSSSGNIVVPLLVVLLLAAAASSN